MHTINNSSTDSIQGGILGLFGYVVSLVFKISEFQDVFQSIIMAAVTTTVGVLTKYLWNLILKKNKTKNNEKA
ncbi:hypothetical protein [Tenacibaculum maritimum]|uniref:hypothetical protein n=1 Tax=Tenacibaculum maritimum TaxID=107401 RepID=UPI0004671FBF|nr:hypothetical protein [Tenacibaculum maritimum]CAA0260336.1 hypothetical protein TMFC_90024 [Tenacibaculum maritimum]